MYNFQRVSKLNVDKVLQRIAYSGPLQPDLSVLRDLQRAFLFSVPFENLDIHANIPILLDPERFYEKIVLNARGGFCYECNSLFHDLLQAIGFDVHIVSAKMMLRDTNAPGYSHMALVVNMDQPYLVDVGNGQSVQEPMPIPGEVISKAEGIDYRVGPYNADEYALYYRTLDSDWAPRFIFSITPRGLGDFKEMCLYHQTSLESPFKRQRLCTLPLPDGRVTLVGDTLSLTQNCIEILEKKVNSATEMKQLLQEYFKLELQILDLS
jgi:N-hydroxyarylamine O-acetyltransferase